MTEAPLAPPWLWILLTVGAAAAQTARNAMQRDLTGRLGTVGATHVRFLFGMPFGLLLLALVFTLAGGPLPTPGTAFAGWLLAGATSQILATALMLGAMQRRSFVVATAYIKTEPVQVALFGSLFLGDLLGPVAIGSIVAATVGVVLMSLPGSSAESAGGRDTAGAVALGLGAAALFAASAVGYRGAILALDGEGFVLRATFTLAIGLVYQAAALSAWLLWRDRAAMVAILRAWRPSLAAGLLGALASQLWFLAFAIETAARVRTLALVEILFAQVVSARIFRQATRPREALGLALVVVGVLVLLAYS
jgi:drug/metabolite transporter (DMT)-like permease